MTIKTLFGIPITTGKRSELLERAEEIRRCGGAIATVNATMLAEAENDPRLKEALLKMDACIPDGVGVSRALCRLGAPTDTLPGVELGRELLMRGEHRLLLFGAREGVAAAAMIALVKENPMIDPVFALDGYSHTEAEVLSLLRKNRVDVVYLALGSPRQEYFAVRIKEEIKELLVIGLGGSFDVWSAQTRRAPKMVRRLGLEWLYRMLREPKRFRKLPLLFRFRSLVRAQERGQFHKKEPEKQG